VAEQRRLDPQPWMKAPATRSVMAALTAQGGEARFVGGCVRDSVIGRPVRDIDIATHEPPDRVMALLADAGIRAIPTGIEHGTVTAVVRSDHFEITTLRTDVKTYGRRAEVAFTDDWAEDAARRDLTFNALSLTEDGILHDPFGGLADLEAGRVRFVGDAETRIREDVLRALRFFRFYAYYGRPPIDAEALAAVEKMAPSLPRLSGERVWGELMRLLRASDPAAVFRLMEAHGILTHLFPGPTWIARLAALVDVEAARGIEGEGADPLRRLAAVMRLDSDLAEALTARLKLSRKERHRLAAMAEAPGRIAADAAPAAARRMIYALGSETYRDAVLLRWARDRAELGPGENDDAYAALLDLSESWPPPELPVKGADAVGLGLPAGPRVGQALARVEAWWIDRDFAPDRAACLDRLRSVVTDPESQE
jgi:poly(A) polymerase